MLTLYARADHPIRQERLRWAFLAAGALAFMDARATWFGGAGAIPFGEDERGFSDPSVLTELYGWTLPTLVGRYQQMATACFVVLSGAYAAGLWTVLADRDAATANSPSSSPRSYRTASTR